MKKNKINIKILLISSVTLAALIISGFYISIYLQKSTSELISEIDKIEASVKDNRWSDANTSMEKLESNWDKLENKWTLFTNHHEIDNISITLKKSIEYIKSQNSSEAMSSLASLRHYLSHIPDMEKLTLKNIF